MMMVMFCFVSTLRQERALLVIVLPSWVALASTRPSGTTLIEARVCSRGLPHLLLQPHNLQIPTLSPIKPPSLISPSSPLSIISISRTGHILVTDKYIKKINSPSPQYLKLKTANIQTSSTINSNQRVTIRQTNLNPTKWTPPSKSNPPSAPNPSQSPPPPGSSPSSPPPQPANNNPPFPPS